MDRDPDGAARQRPLGRRLRARTRLGRWEYSIVAWIDRLASWRHELQRKVEAARPISPASSPRERRCSASRSSPSRKRSTRAGARPPPRGRDRSSDPLELIVDRDRATFGAWYELFPRSFGGFAGVERVAAGARRSRLRRPLLPADPPDRRRRTARARTTRSTAGPDDPGSPWAIGAKEGGHTAIAPELGTLADFESLVAAAAEHDLEIALDLALQCSPDHPWLTEHPDWFQRRPDGTLKYAENPPKRYQDIYNLNFQPPRTGGRSGRRSSTSSSPGPGAGSASSGSTTRTRSRSQFWSWLIREAQAVHPDLVFLSEAFTRPAMMATLAKAGFSQSYTYFTWRNTRHGAHRVHVAAHERRPAAVLPAELLHEHAGHPHRVPRSTAAARPSRPGSCSQRRSRRATGSTRASRTSRARRASRAARSTSTRRSTS